ncbi:hypothetical protein Tco_1354662 [Tanacetum coccineum]
MDPLGLQTERTLCGGRVRPPKQTPLGGGVISNETKNPMVVVSVVMVVLGDEGGAAVEMVVMAWEGAGRRGQ